MKEGRAYSACKGEMYMTFDQCGVTHATKPAPEGLTDQGQTYQVCYLKTNRSIHMCCILHREYHDALSLPFQWMTGLINAQCTTQLNLIRESELRLLFVSVCLRL